jgi:hypothetical protein
MATMFLVCCLVIVGTMFAVTSQYQDIIVMNMINMSNHYLRKQDSPSDFHVNFDEGLVQPSLRNCNNGSDLEIGLLDINKEG